MKKVSLTFLAIVFIFGISGTSVKLKPWPADKIEHDLPYRAYEKPRLMPLEEFDRAITRKNTKKLFPEFPLKQNDGLEKNLTLIQAQSPVKNQGPRGQCHNFAVTGAIEYALWVGLGKAFNFSEQCNAWKFYKDCVICSNNPDSEDDGGMSLFEAFYIHNKFMKFEADYPYSADPLPCKYNYNDTPYEQFEDLHVYWLLRKHVKTAIDKHFVVMLGAHWKRSGWNYYGEFPYKEKYKKCNSEDCGGHAILLVGYDDNYYGPGKGGFIFKNSWSPNWGRKKGVKPSGYGVMPYTYAKQFAKTYAALTHRNAYPDPIPSCYSYDFMDDIPF